MSTIDNSEPGGVLTIDLDAVVGNWRELARRAAPAQCAAVVKADAYGCGVEPVTAALAKAGCDTFFVAQLAEGRAVRATARDAAVYVLNGLAPESAAAHAACDLRPVLGSVAEIREWQDFVRATRWHGPAALHVDTGMNRLGLTFEEAERLAASADALPRLSLVMSHFACAEMPDHPLNAKQIAAFQRVRALFPGVEGSLANSSGIFLGPDAHHDLVRPGVALYGGNPILPHLNPMRPVAHVQGRIVQVREAATGATVGYGATWTARRPSRVAIVSIGYADGILRATSPDPGKEGARAIVSGHPCPFVGKVSMDLIAIDVTDVPHDRPRRGSWATLLGDEITVDDLAAHAGTVSYEILTSLGRRYRRVYRGGSG
jgi:alanine racemase